ncbi:hypothetical protein [Bradyrhizobium sp. USDA 10063]
MTQRHPSRRQQIRGILHESEGAGQSGQSAFIVVGISINVDHHPTTDALYPTTSRRNKGSGIGGDAVITELTRICVEILSLWSSSGYSALQDDLTKSMLGISEHITVWKGVDPAQHHSGLFKGLDDNGHLILETKPRRTGLRDGRYPTRERAHYNIARTLAPLSRAIRTFAPRPWAGSIRISLLYRPRAMRNTGSFSTIS